MHKTQSGIGIAFVILALNVLMMLSIGGFLWYRVSVKNAIEARRVQTTHLMQQAADAIMVEATDTDGDGVVEMKAFDPAASPAPSGGGGIPATSSAPRMDAFSTSFGYCVWDNGTTNTSTNRITGANPATSTSVMFALISAGPDRVFQTSCVQAQTGNVQGDDLVRYFKLADYDKGLAGTGFHGTPVVDATSLGMIATSGLNDGQLRLMTGSQSLLRWNSASGSWTGVSAGNSNPANGFKNKLINGNFDLWQRAANTNVTFTATPGNWAYTADHWRIENGSGSSGSVTAVPVSLAMVSGVPNGARYGIQITPQSANNGLALGQPVEGVQTLAGQTVTVSLWAMMTTSGNDSLQVQFHQAFGNNAAPPDNYTIATPSAQALTTTWQKYTFTATLPAIPSGAAFNVGQDNLALEISITGTTPLQIAQVQLEAGSQATTFDYRPLAQELRMAMRYYESNHYWIYTSEITYNGGNELWQYVPGNAAVLTPHLYKVPKRIASAWTNTPSVAYRANLDTIDVNDTTAGASNTTSTGFTAFTDATNCNNVSVTICAVGMTQYGFQDKRTANSTSEIKAEPIWWEVDAEYAN